MLEFAASRPVPTVVVAPAVVLRYFPRDKFDYRALASWVCVALDGPPPGVRGGEDAKGAVPTFESAGSERPIATRPPNPTRDGRGRESSSSDSRAGSGAAAEDAKYILLE